jgi:hypothetical protein
MLKITGIKGLFQCLLIGMLGLALGACDDVSDWGKGSSSSSSSINPQAVVTTFGTISSGSTILSLPASNPAIVVGMVVNSSTAGLAAGTTVTAVAGTSVTLSQPATAGLAGATFNFCSACYLVGGTVTGYNPAYGALTLVNRGGNALVLSSNGSYFFTAPVQSGFGYLVTVSASGLTAGAGAAQNCSVTNGTGTVPTQTNAVGTVASGSKALTLNAGNSGIVVGMRVTSSSAGLAAGVTVTAVSGASVTLSAATTAAMTDAAFTFTPVNVTNVNVNCGVPTYTVSGDFSDLKGNVVLKLSASDNISQQISVPLTCAGALPAPGCPGSSGDGGGAFAFSIPLNLLDSKGAVQAYSVSIVSQSPSNGLNCTVQNGSNFSIQIPNSITDVKLICNRTAYAFNANVTGLAQGATLQLTKTINSLNDNDPNKVEALSVNAIGNKAFTSVKTGERYSLVVSQQPLGQTCSVQNGTGYTVDAGAATGLIAASAVTVNVNCVKTPFTIAVSNPALATVSVTGTTQNNSPSAASNITFNDTYGDAGVALSVQKTGNTCTVGGTPIPSPITGNITGVTISCTPNQYHVKVTVKGLADTGAPYTAPVLGLNGSYDSLTLATPLPTSDTTYTFTKTLAYGSTYAVDVTDAQIKGHAGVPLCVLDTTSGTVGVGDVSLTLTCSADNFSVGGTITGLTTGTGLVLVNGSDSTPISAGGNFTMANLVPKAATYNVTVGTQPTGQTCLVVSNGSGTMGTSNVSNISITCDNGKISGTITGLPSGVNLTLANNAADGKQTTGTGSDVSFTLAPPAGAYANGTAYKVAVQGPQPQGQTCLVTNPQGSINGGDVTNVLVQCTYNTYTVGGTIILDSSITTLPAQGNGLSINMSYTLGVNDDTSNTCSSGPVTSGVCNAKPVEIFNAGGNPGNVSAAIACPNNIGIQAQFPNATSCIAWNFTDQIHAQPITLSQTQTTVTTGAQPYGVSCTLYSVSGTTYTVAPGNPPNVKSNVGAGNVNSSNVVYYCSATSYAITGTVAGVPANSGTAGMQAYSAINLQVVTNEGGPSGPQNTYTQQFTGNGAFTLAAPIKWTKDDATDPNTYPTTRNLAANNTLVYNDTNNQLFSVSVGGTCGSPGLTAPSVTTPTAGNSQNTLAVISVTDTTVTPNVTTSVVNCPLTVTNGAYPFTPFGTALYSYAGTYTAPTTPYSHATGTTYTASLIKPVGYLQNNNTANTADTLGNGIYPLHNTCSLSAPGATYIPSTGVLTGTITNDNPAITVTCTPYEVPVTITFNGYASGGGFTAQSTVSLFGTPGPSFASTSCAPACEIQTLSSTGTASATGSTNGAAPFKTYLKPGTTWYATFTQPVMTTSPRTCTLYSAGTSTNPLTVGTSAITSAFGNCTLNSPADGFMFVANSGNKTVTQYIFAADGTPTLNTTSVITGSLGTAGGGVVPFGTGGPVDVAIAPNGMAAYVLDAGNKKVNNYSVAAKVLGAPVSNAAAISVAISLSPVTPNPFALALTPSGMNAFVTDNAGGVVYGYSVVGGPTGANLASLTTPYNLTGSGVPTLSTTGSGPRGITFDPTSTYAYVVNGNDGTVSQFTVTGNGLTALGAMGTGGVTLNTFTVGHNPYYAVVEPSGRYLYVTNKDDNTISQFSICQAGSTSCPMVGVTPTQTVTSTGGSVGGLSALSPATASLPAGNGPVGITANDTSVFVTTSDGKVVQYTIGATGQLTPNASLNTGSIAAGTSPFGVVTAFGSLTAATSYTYSATTTPTTQTSPKLYVANQGGDSIQSYLMDYTVTLSPYPLINALTPSLTPGVTSQATGSGPLNMAIFK